MLINFLVDKPGNLLQNMNNKFNISYKLYLVIRENIKKSPN